jgi:ribosomal-protein-alanine N-acetyltransferase
MTSQMKPIPSLETQRMVLRPFISSDLDEYARCIFADPEVTRFLAKREISPRERAERAMAYFNDHWDQHGYGDWAVTVKAGEQLIGHCGLNYLDEAGEVEVEYSLARAYWGRGLATEAARAAVGFGFEGIGLERIIALAVPENIASRRVMEHLGMVYEKEVHFFGLDLLYYKMTREQFLFKDGS